jgi:glycerol uptake facilitator-like aquaporin
MRGIAMDKNLRSYLAELVGTFALVLLGAGTVCANHLSGTPQPGLLGIALAQGLIFAAILSRTVLATEGYLNPAVTVMLYCYRRFDGVKATWLVVAQMLGAALAGLCVRFVFDEVVLTQARLGTPHLNPDAFPNPGLAALLQGSAVELGLTFILTFAIFGTILDPRTPRLAGFGAGLALTADVLMGFGLTGAACNPARYFGTALWEKTVPALRDHAFDDHPVYWIGPILGALLAGGLYTKLLLPQPADDKVTG